MQTKGKFMLDMTQDQQQFPPAPTHAPGHVANSTDEKAGATNTTQPDSTPTSDEAPHTNMQHYSFAKQWQRLIPGSKQAEMQRIAAAHVERMERQLDDQIALAEKELQDLSDGPDGVQPIIIELNQKGGAGKSADATSSAVTIGKTTGQTVIVVDNNQVLGSTLEYLGIERTLGIRRSMETFRINSTNSNVIRHLGHHPRYRNIYGVDSDDAIARHDKPIDPNEYYDFSQGLSKACHTLIMDNGNEVKNVQTLVGIEVAHVLRFVFIPWVNLAAKLCRDTMQEIKQLYPEKVANSVIVISACQDSDMNAEEWADYFNHPKEQICFIPYDPIFEPRRAVSDKSQEEVWVINHDQLTKPTYLANLHRDILTLQQARKAISKDIDPIQRRNQDLERVRGFLPGDDAVSGGEVASGPA